jgi:hypothetical protein
MHEHSIPLSKYILDFELLSIFIFPLLLISTRVAEEFTVMAKAWGGAIALGIGLQVSAMGVRTYTYPMRWSFAIPDHLREDVDSARQGPPAGETAIVLSRPPLNDHSPGQHVCYQVIIGTALAEKLKENQQETVEVEYPIYYRFNTPGFFYSPRLKRDDLNRMLKNVGFGFVGREGRNSDYRCFPGRRTFR